MNNNNLFSKVRLCGLILGVIILVLGTGNSLLEATPMYISPTTVLNFREDPSTDSLIIKKLNEADILKVDYETEDGWYAVENEKSYGFVKKEYTAPISSSLKDKKVISKHSTYISNRQKGRMTNIELAVKKINSMYKIAPGETFSFNDCVGRRTAERGFKLAPVIIAGNKHGMGYGGGICQVSSTLYGAIYNVPGIKVVSVTKHTIPGLYPYDATVSWPNPDFRFKNTNNYPIYFWGCVSSNQVTFIIRR